MISKHTKGPWVTTKFGNQVLTGDSWNTICVLSGNANWKGDSDVCEQEYEWQNQLANAVLIANAPDLLDAVQRFVSWCDEWYAGKPHPYDDLVFARNLLKKISEATP